MSAKMFVLFISLIVCFIFACFESLIYFSSQDECIQDVFVFASQVDWGFRCYCVIRISTSALPISIACLYLLISDGGFDVTA